MPRAKAFDPSLALDRAVELFWQRGYEGASMTLLLEAMDISRQSLYDTFGDKHKRALVSELSQLRHRADALVRAVSRFGSAVTARRGEDEGQQKTRAVS